MLELQITRTSRTPANKSDWVVYDIATAHFETLEDVKKHVKSEYWHCKTTYPTYIDKADGTTQKIGRIYAYKGKDYDEKYRYFRDWVTLFEVEYTEIPLP